MKETKFKHTEIGLIPEDWEVVSIERVGTNYSYGVGAEAIPFDGKNKYLRITDIDDKTLRFLPAPLVSPSYYSEDYVLKENEIVVARTGASVGKSYCYDSEDGRLIYAGFLMKFRVSHNYARYIFYQLSTPRYWTWITMNSMRSGQPGINLQQLKEFLLPLPPTKDEQKRIATALYDIDTLIRDLDRTIEKKQNIRQGAMEQLLSGKKRLPGFKGEWTEFVFDNIFKSISTRGKEIEVSDYLPTGKYPIIDQGKEQVVGYTNYSQPIMAKGGGYLVFGDHTRIFKYISRDFYVGADGTKVLECKDGYYPAFMFYKCLLLNIPNTGYNRHFVYLKESAFYIPTDIKEQYAIADTLTAMDDEIAVLQMEREKYANIRSGMMDDLLTGRKRL